VTLIDVQSDGPKRSTVDEPGLPDEDEKGAWDSAFFIRVR